MKVKLTQAVIENLPAAEGKQYIVDDAGQDGLQLAVSPRGIRTWYCYYIINGQRRRPSLGRWPGLSLAKARDAAKRIIGEATEGKDFSMTKRGIRQGMTLKEFCEEVFMPDAKQRMKPRSLYEHQHRLDKHILPALGSKKLNSLTVEDIRRLHRKLADTPTGANRILELLRLIINRAIQWGHLPEGHGNPALKVDRYPERPRERFLDSGELKKLAGVLDKAEAEGTEPLHALLAIRLLIMTGCRRNEILELEWCDVDLEHSALMLPDEKTKTGRRLVPLSPQAMVILDRLLKIHTKDHPYVIEGHRGGQRLVGIHRIWERLRVAAGMPELRLHDLRHSFASSAVWAGVNLPLVGGLLGHRQPRTTGRYSHLSNEVLVTASDLVGSAIEKAMTNGNKGAAKVVELKPEAEGDQKKEDNAS